MHEPIDHVYFDWLCAKAISITAKNPFYRTLLKVLHETEFVWIVPGDRHRAEDGLELRRNFLVESGLDDDSYWRDLGCSVLEMLIAFSRRAWFQTEMDPKEWFWIFMRNLGLDEMSDASDPDPQVISDILYTFVWRTYNLPMEWEEDSFRYGSLRRIKRALNFGTSSSITLRKITPWNYLDRREHCGFLYDCRN